MTLSLIAARNQYNATPVGLIFKGPDPQTNAQPYRHHTFSTTLELDTHHHHLLRSDDAHEVVLGLYSVIYWSQYSTRDGANDPESSTLISHRELSPRIGNMDADLVRRIVRNSIVDLDNNIFPHALITISKLLHSRLSLASTFLAFIDPEKVGVFDDQITTHLVSANVDETLGKPIDKTLARPNQETLQEAATRYGLYCDVLREIKNAINTQRTGWQDKTNCQMARFRAIDIQRALLVQCQPES